MFYSAVLLATNSFGFLYFGKVFISLSFLKNFFSGYRILCRLFFLSVLQMAFQCLGPTVSEGNSTIHHTAFPFYMTCHFSVAASRFALCFLAISSRLSYVQAQSHLSLRSFCFLELLGYRVDVFHLFGKFGVITC